MKWFEGGIPAAIQAAKANKSVFIVLVTDDKEASATMEAHLHQEDVTGMCEGRNCVAVRLLGSSNECKFFSQIYPVVVIPSTFFIAHSGVPLEVVGEVATHNDFVAKVKAALDMQDKIVAEQESITASSTQGSAPSNEAAGASAEPEQKKQKVDDVPLEDKVDRARELVELTQEKKAKKEADEEKQREFERRQIGQGVQKLRERQKEQDIREAGKEFRKNKEDDRLAREKVKEDIARDRAEKAERHSKQKEERSLAQEEERKRKLEQQATQQTEQARRSDEARLQFRKPDGSSVTHTFPATDTFASVHTFITQHMGCTVSLSTTFPRRTFTPADHDSTLQELELAPSAAILVMMGSGSSNVVRSSNDVSSIYSVLTLLFSPLVYVWTTLTNMLGLSGNRAPASQPSPAGKATKSEAPQASGGARSQGNAHRRQAPASSSRQEGNIRRFHNNDDDPDDESNTWNGNSTQQM